jgi:hypothetical protein
MRTALFPALLLVLLSSGVAAHAAGRTDDFHVRPLTPAMRTVLDAAVERSPLVRAQVSALDRSDTVVYLTDEGPLRNAEPHGYLQFLSAGGGRRYLTIWIDRWALAPNDRIELLAHELQHALEVAASPRARDLAGFEALYRAIGREGRHGRFETEGARRVTVQVRAELAAGRPAV